MVVARSSVYASPAPTCVTLYAEVRLPTAECDNDTSLADSSTSLTCCVRKVVDADRGEEVWDDAEAMDEGGVGNGADE